MNIPALLQAARNAESSGHPEKTAFLCNQALQQDPGCLEALLMLGSLCARHGRSGEAEALLRRAAAADPKSYDAVRWLTTLLIGRNGGRDAVEFGRKAVDLRPNEAEAHAVLGLAAIGAGDSSLAITSLERAVEINSEMSGAHHNLGVAYQREESFDEAIESLSRAAELSPNVLETQLHLGRCFLAKDMGEEALECADIAMRLDPNSISAKRLLADANFAAVQGDKGLDRIRSAIECDPQAAFPQALMGSRLQEQGNFAEAEGFIRKSIELQPIQGFAYYLLAHNGKIRTEDWAAFETISETKDLSNLIVEERQYMHFGLGKAYDDLGDYESAMRHFDAAHEEQHSEPGSRSFSLNKHAARAHGLARIFNREALDRFADLAMDTEEPIFIFGMPRSGTTLLEQIVSRHSSVGAGGELFFWRDSSRRIVNLSEPALNPSELTKAGNRYLNLIRSLAPGKAHVTDKFPSNYLYLGMLQLVYPKAIFLHARRHPIDTCLSIYMRPFSTNQGLGRSRGEIVGTYREYLASMEHWREALGPNRFLDVHYEQLVQNPEEVTRQVIAYCGLEWEDACLRPQEGDRRVVTFSKWQVRQPVYTTSVERWRKYEPWLGEFLELIAD